jgi:hypothetical protein
VLIVGDAGDREANQRHPGSGRRGVIDEGPLLMDVQTSITRGLMTAYDPTETSSGIGPAIN